MKPQSARDTGDTAVPSRTGPGRRPAATPQLGRLRPGDPAMLEMQVYTRLRRAMMTGAVRAKASFSTRTLADQFGISPMPVRSALKRLEAENILRAQPRSGYRLIPLHADEYVEILQIRSRIEGMAAALAAARIDEAGLDRVRRWNAALAQPGSDYRRILHRNHGFHFEIYRAAQSPILLSNIEMYWVRIGPVLHESLGGYDQAKILKTHDTIIDALANRDATKAETAMRSDLFSASGPVIEALSPAPDHFL